MFPVISCDYIGEMFKPSEDDITNKIGSSGITVENLSSGVTTGECNSYIRFPSDKEYSSLSAPAESSGPSISVTGNDTAIPGGSILLTVEADQTASFIIVSVKGVPGYYRLANELDPRTSLQQIEISFASLISSKQLTLEFRTENSARAIGRVFEYNVNITQVKTGKVQVSLSFDDNTDLDLHVFEPDGTDIYWLNAESDNGGKLDLDANAACESDAMKKINNENIYWSKTAKGEYRVIINYYQYCTKYCKSDEVNWTVTVNNKGEITRYRGQMSKKNVGEFWEIARFTVK